MAVNFHGLETIHEPSNIYVSFIRISRAPGSQKSASSAQGYRP
jgi:hypothetical protein